jgi:DNA repair exonuclease SbcCD ATPase subunit
MDLIFRKLVIEDFKTIKHLIFNFDRAPGLHLIEGQNKRTKRLGSNGAGKSSILDALCFCLFRKTVKGLGAPDVRPWKATKHPTVVKLTYMQGDETHSITRSIAPNTLLYDSKEVSQDKLEDELGFNYETFTHTIILGQGQELFFDLTPTKKMQVFSEALNLDRWEKRASNASKMATKLEVSAGNTKVAMEGKLEQYERSHNQFLKAKEAARDWASARSATEADIEKKIKECRKRLDTYQKNYDNADLALDSAETELRPLEKQGKAISAELVEVKTALQVADHRHEADALEIARLQEELRKIKAGKCPTCNGPFSNMPHRLRLEEKIRTLEAGLKKLNLKDLKLNVEAVKKRGAALIASTEGFLDKANKARDELDMWLPQLSDCKAKIREFEAQMAEQENPFTRQMMDFRKQKSQDWHDYQDLKREFTLTERKAKRVRYWAKGFKDLQLYQVTDVLQELEIATNAMLEQFGLIGWEIQYATEKELKSGDMKRGLDVYVQSPDNAKPVKWECWSGGEAQRLRVAGALALSEVLLARAGVEPSLEVLDEPSSHMSSEGVADLCDFLALRADQLGKVIFFVDQTVVESAVFKSVTTVMKTTEKGTFLVE